MSYKRTLIFLAAFAALAVFLYVYEIRGGEARRETERKAQLLFSFEPNDVTTLTVKRPGELIVVRKEHDKWEITEPVSASAEQQTVNGILDALAELKFARDLGVQTDLQPFGLTAPETELEFEGKAGTIGKLLLGGFTPEGGNFYAKRPVDDRVFTVQESAKGKLNKTLFDIRDKTVFDFATPDVTGVSITRDNRTLAFKKGPDDKQWMMTQPEEHDADAPEISALLDSIRYARVKEFVEEKAGSLEQYGLAEPAAVVNVDIGETVRSLSFGKKVEADPKAVYARRNESMQVLKLDAEILDVLKPELDEWRDRRLVKIKRDDVSKLQLETSEGVIALQRSEGAQDEWNITEPEQAPADNDAVNELFGILSDAKITRFLKTEEAAVIAPTVGAPLINLRLWSRDSETPEIIDFFKPENATDAYAEREEQGEFFVVDSALPEKLTLDPAQLKDKSVVRFKEPDVEKIEIARGGKSYTLEMEGVNWKVPNDIEMESYEVDQFLWDLRELKYKSVEPGNKSNEDYGFASPALTIRLLHADGEEVVNLKISGKAEQDSYYVLVDDTDSVVVVESKAITNWLEMF